MLFPEKYILLAEKILYALGVIFFTVFFWLSLFWRTAKKEERRKFENIFGAFLHSLLYTFLVFLGEFFALITVSLINKAF